MPGALLKQLVQSTKFQGPAAQSCNGARNGYSGTTWLSPVDSNGAMTACGSLLNTLDAVERTDAVAHAARCHLFCDSQGFLALPLALVFRLDFLRAKSQNCSS
jgi:hypothetical protein